MLLQTKILLGLGAGVAGVGGGLLIRKAYLNSLPQDDQRADNMVGDSFGNTQRPTIVRAPQQPVSAPARVGSGGHTLMPAIGPPGTLRVKINKPDCEIVYDPNHYKGTGLAARFDVGEKISWSKGNEIMQWYAWDGPETKNQTSDGKDYNLVHITGSFYIKYLGQDEFTALHKKLGSHPPLQEIWDWEMAYGAYGSGAFSTAPPKPKASDILGYTQGKSSGASKSSAESYLASHGYQFVKAEYGETVELSLAPGWYQIIARPVWQPLDKGWRYLRGYWHWTNNGPRGKSASSQWKRFKNGGCTNKLTQFSRVVEQDRWGDLDELVEVVSNKKVSTTVNPLVELAVTNRATKKNGYSRAFNAACTGYKVGEKVFKKVMGVKGRLIWWLAERFFGKMIKKYS